MSDELTESTIYKAIKGRWGAKVTARNNNRTGLLLCPFHEERTPSFVINAESNTYHCLSCHVAGDTVSFIMTFDKISYPEAVRRLEDFRRPPTG